MVRKFNILSIAFLLAVYIALLNFIDLISAERVKVANILASLAENKIEIQKNLHSIVEKFDNYRIIKIDFWELEPDSLEQGKYIGSALLKRGNLTIDIKDENLRNILNSPYTPIGELSEEGTIRDWKIEYQPGSISHLKSIAQEAWRWNYLSKTEIISPSKN
ncbi:MAG: hypothetical protein P9L98_03600 [Candidatus Kaelpia imicola]|nr:hypothetical protein [Candidatus Kaelpia imicola]